MWSNICLHVRKFTPIRWVLMEKVAIAELVDAASQTTADVLELTTILETDDSTPREQTTRFIVNPEDSDNSSIQSGDGIESGFSRSEETSSDHDSGVEVTTTGEYTSTGAPDPLPRASSLISRDSSGDCCIQILSCKSTDNKNSEIVSDSSSDSTIEDSSESSSVTGNKLGKNGAGPVRKPTKGTKERVTVTNLNKSTRPKPTPAPRTTKGRAPNLATSERARIKESNRGKLKPTPPPGPKMSITSRFNLKTPPNSSASCREPPSIKVKGVKTSSAWCRAPRTSSEEPRRGRVLGITPRSLIPRGVPADSSLGTRPTISNGSKNRKNNVHVSMNLVSVEKLVNKKPNIEKLEQRVRVLLQTSAKVQEESDLQTEKMGLALMRLEEERAEKMAAQQDLQKIRERVQGMLGERSHMESDPEDCLLLLESQLLTSASTIIKQQEELIKLHATCEELQKELELKHEVQLSLKTNLRRVEIEAAEMREFLQEERNMMAEAIKDMEKSYNRAEWERVSARIDCGTTSRLEEQRQQEAFFVMPKIALHTRAEDLEALSCSTDSETCCPDNPQSQPSSADLLDPCRISDDTKVNTICQGETLQVPATLQVSRWMAPFSLLYQHYSTGNFILHIRRNSDNNAELTIERESVNRWIKRFFNRF